MAIVTCPSCTKTFDSDNTNSIVTRAAAAGASGVVGFKAGGSVGMVAGPLGGISGAVPGALVGVLTGYTLANQARRCIHCMKIFRY